MTVRHHPEEALLFDYASGAVDEGLALIVATHLCFCPACRETVSLAEAMGGALLDASVPMQVDALAATLARLDETAPAPAAPRSRDGTPSPLRHLLGGDIADVRWRALGPNLGYRNLFRRGGTRVRLLKGAPGADTGTHGHKGREYTLVLRGGFSDETGSYAPGDLQVANPETVHNPVADKGEPCINLAVTTAPLKFDALIPRLAARLFGF
jgi:putative transcriptional regulator